MYINFRGERGGRSLQKGLGDDRVEGRENDEKARENKE